MPSRVGIDPSRQFTEIEPEIRDQFLAKSCSGDLCLSKAKGLYVSNGAFNLAPEDAIRHKEVFHDKREKMMAAGREIEDHLKEAINREFPRLRPKGQTLGDYALSRAKSRKLDVWAFRERQRIEELGRDKHLENKDVEFPYELNSIEKKALLGEKLTSTEKEHLLHSTMTEEQKAALTSRVNNGDIKVISPDLWASKEHKRIEQQLYDPQIRNENIKFPYHLDGIQKKLLIDEKLTATEKEYLLKSTLTEEQKATLASSYDAFDFSDVNNFVLEGLDVAAQLERNVDLQHAARDHLMILKARDLNPDDVVSVERHVQRHRIVEGSRLLRNAIAGDLATNPSLGSRAAAAAAAFVSNLQTSSDVLAPSNLMKAVQILQSLGCGTEQVEKLGNLKAVEQALRGTIPVAHGLNRFIERSAGGSEFEAERANIRYTIEHSAFALESASALLNDMQAFDPNAREQVATRLMDSVVSFTNLCNRPLFKNAAKGSSAHRLAEKLAEQARIANELALALRTPSVGGDMPLLRNAAAPEVRQPGNAAFASTSKEREAKRLFATAIKGDLTSSGTFPKETEVASIAAANILLLLPADQPALTSQNIAKVEYLLSCLRLSNGHVSQLRNHVDLDNTIFASISQIHDLNEKTIAAIKSMGGDPINRYHLFQFTKKAYTNKIEGVLNDVKGFLISGRFDDEAERLRLFNKLKKVSRGCERTLQFMEREIRYSTTKATYAPAIQAVEAQMAAVCDLARELYPSNDSEVLSRAMEAFYSQGARDPSRLARQDVAVLEERVESPNILFHSDAQRLKSHEDLEEPVRQYNNLIDQLKSALRSFRESGMRSHLRRLSVMVSQALKLNVDVTNTFQSINQFRNTGKHGRHDEGTPALKAQRECLQALQSNVLRASIPQYQRSLDIIVEEEDDLEQDWPVVTAASSGDSGIIDELAEAPADKRAEPEDISVTTKNDQKRAVS
ncbi:MAG: hypothetical protein AAGC95_01440 [Pseudomonadota bacterium]